MTVQTRAALQALATDPPLDHASDGDALVRDIVDSYGKWETVPSDYTGAGLPVASIEWTSIPAGYSQLRIILDAVSHNDTGNSRFINLGLSIDNGSNWLTNMSSTPSVADTVLADGVIHLQGLNSNSGLRLGYIAAQTSGITSGTLTSGGFVIGGAVNALRIAWNVGSFDACTLARLEGR